ncbi:hypothetical protein [Amycolatopsis sp. NPDC003676]
MTWLLASFPPEAVSIPVEPTVMACSREASHVDVPGFRRDQWVQANPGVYDVLKQRRPRG